MHCGFETARQSFAELVARKQQPLAMRGAYSVEIALLIIWAVVNEPVLRVPPLLLRLQCLQYE